MVHIVSTVSVFIVNRVPCSSLYCIIFITLMKVPHHGSRNSTSKDFLELVKPEYAFIFAGKDNRYKHPHKELLERLCQIGCEKFITYECGAITVSTDGKNLKINTYR